jgi:hypothetical protein
LGAGNFNPIFELVGGQQQIPPEIRPLVSERHILASEDPQAYDNLFTALMGMGGPKTCGSGCS